MSLYSQSLFHLLSSLDDLPTGKDVYIISDEQYEQLRLSEIDRELKLLQKRANSYRKSADLIDEEIKDIQKQAGIPTRPDITAEEHS